jgi:Family of unknown function (DUF5977)
MRKLMKKSRVQLTLLFFAILSFQPVIAQNPNQSIEVSKMQWQAKQVVPPSPDAAELGKYGNVPVSLYTGTPSVAIPLFTLTGNSLSLPVSLSYNASGYKPEDAAPWVGSGWSLNAGGVITRAAMGNPDNTTNYYGVTNLLNPPNELDVVPYYYYIKDIQEGTKETQPDIYYYNFNGHAGKFIIRPDYTVAKTEKDLNIITPFFNGGSLDKFTVVDEQGITYFFEAVETTHMVPNDAVGQPSTQYYNFSSAWYLTKMYSADGVDDVEFEYHDTSAAQTLYQNVQNNKSSSYTYGVKYEPGWGCGPTSVDETSEAYNQPPLVTIIRKFLKKITLKKFATAVAYIDVVSTAGQRLDAESFSGDRLVNQLKLYSTGNGSDKLIKQFNLGYGYFANLQNLMYKRRLRLDTLQEISTNVSATSPPPYLFTYNTSFVLPERVTTSLDHWGFYNEAINSSLVPYFYFPGGIQANVYFAPRNIGDGANREASLSGSSATLLTKIQYPTGGYTTFEYELNQAKVNNTLKDIGGVRIKQIIDYSFPNKQAVIKNYSYLLDDSSSSGNIGAWPDYHTNSTYHHYWLSYHICSYYDNPFVCCENYNEHSEYDLYTISLSANSIFGLGSFQGSHIGYSQVTESQVDLATNQPLGKTVYNYYIGEYWEHNDDIRSGDLIKQTVYRNDNKMLEETTSTYQWSVDYDIEAKVPKANELQTNKPYYCKISTNNYQNYGNWQTPPSNCTGLTNIGTKSHLEAYAILLQNKQLTQQVHKVYDQLSNSYLTATKNFTYGNPNHNFPTLIEEITSNGEKVKTSIKYVMDYDHQGTSNVRYMQDANMMGVPVEKLQYREDANGTNRRYINGQFTDYTYGRPLQLFFLEAQPLLTSVTPSATTTGWSMIYDSHYRLAATMGYDNLGNLNQQSKTNDAVTSYIWDYNQTYPVASVTGAASNQFFYTSFESNGKGGFSFTGSPVAGTAITGKQYYNLSGSSISAGINSSTSYILSYWRNSNSGPYSVSGSTSYKQGATKNGWTYYEHAVTGVSTTTVTGSGYIDELRLYPATAQMTTQTFEPLIGITSQCSANSQLVYYEYDGLNRLVNIKDDDGNIVKNFKYNYGLGAAPAASTQTLFYNAPIQQDYSKAGCTGGTYGDIVTYIIPYGKHASSISQADANAKAQADTAANGQAYANSTGLCRWWSAARHAKVFKNDCTYEQGGGGGFVWYDVPFGKYKSLISQADADAMAQTDINTLGQAYANENGTCSCAAEGQRFINGVCETGQLYHGSAVHLPDGSWQCSYYYTFTDAYVTGYYYYYSSDPCPIDP